MNVKEYNNGVLYNGNNLDIIKNLENNYVDLTITSPPYDNLRSYTNDSPWNWEIFQGLSKEIFRVTKDGGVVVWIVNDATEKGSETGTSFRQALYFKDECGFNLHDTMIWQKTNFSNPSSNRYHQIMEYMFVFSKGKPKTFNPIKDRKNIYGGVKGSYGKNTVTQKDGSKKQRNSKINSEFGMRYNVWLTKTTGQDSSSKKYDHPAMFPVNLITDHILSWSNEGDTVFDPFMGSGTTAVAANNVNRKWIGIEVSKKYFDISNNRIKNTLDII